MKLSTFKNTQERRAFLERELGISLSNISKAHITSENQIHCENLIGETTLPLGVAGPLKIIKKNNVLVNYYLPLATTEGALVASVNRGCKAVSLSGGVKVIVKKKGVTRGPVFQTETIERGFWFLKWLEKNKNYLKKISESTSSYLKFKNFEAKVIGPYTFVRFFFETDQAMGMNMATIAVSAVSNFIEEKTGIKCLALSGNYCVDKKASWLNFIEERGYQAWAEVKISKTILLKTLKVTPDDFYQVWLAKSLIGSIISGSLGYNGHFANIVAAFFAATGQDLAHVVEGSLGLTTTKILPDESLFFSIYLPSIMIGMVGGGTKMDIKKEAVSITRAKTTRELVELLAGGVIAGEVSLLASLAEGSLAKVHKSLGR